jgi:hypothetical protein
MLLTSSRGLNDFFAGAEGNLQNSIWILQMKIYSYLHLDIKPTDQQYDVFAGLKVK